MRTRLVGIGAPCLALVVTCGLLSACATSQGSFLGGSPAQSSQRVAFETASPDLIAVGGNALLPGSRRPATALLLGAATTAAAPLLAPSLSTGTVRVSLAGEPLLALGGGPPNLLGQAPAPALGGAAGGLAAGASTASTALLARLAALPPAAATPTGPAGGGSPPTQAPHLGSTVPGATSLASLVDRLSTSLGVPGH